MTTKKSTQKRDARTNRCCFANQTYCFFAVLVAVAVVVAKASLKESGRAGAFFLLFTTFSTLPIECFHIHLMSDPEGNS